MPESGGHGWMPDSVVGALYRPGELMILNGGKLGRYRIVSRDSLDDLGGYARWDDTIMAAVRLVSPKVALWLESQREISLGLGPRLVRSAHLFVLGRFAEWATGAGYDVGSEFDDGTWYRVVYGVRPDNRSCTCPDYERQSGLGDGWTARLGGSLVCKHILAVRLWRMYRNGGEELKDGMVSDSAGSNSHLAAD